MQGLTATQALSNANWAPTLSILIPAYNAAPFLDETIESALSQTFADREIILLDDGSTDDTLAIARRYEQHGLRVYTNGHNRGAVFTYNQLLLRAQGKYVTFLDADDIYLPPYCERVLSAMNERNAHIGFANLLVLEGTQRLSTTLYGTPRDPRFAHMYGGPDARFPNDNPAVWRSLILQGVHISPRALYRRELFVNFGLEDTRLRITHDWLRHINFVLHGAQCVYVDEPLGYYRLHPGGNSQRDPMQTAIENTKLFEIVQRDFGHLLNEAEREGVHNVYREMRARVLDGIGKSQLNNREVIQFLLERSFGL
ncbi:glycosyltransferase family 2 protein [Alicyclobacillus sp. ALC3]|uniref:glycosyltransferase family 2 protein n=1 Tax=Alicyclobacillus sp. ALC3 TaxID=2796143 RepID=UPI0023794570|nr:glycosyltransferase [Alicyclobacillus sp. ALC3]WDL95296.1 glycosyltransferase [Alicyclobacillus sp. ALC3]